jgi:methionine sulfoxide reductase heme-binding subunit
MNRESEKLLRFGHAALRFAGALAAVVLVAWLGGWLIGGSGFAGTAPWFISRAAGIVAYGLLSVSSLLGIAMTTQFWSRSLSRPSLNGLHEQLSWLALGFLILHVGALLVDTFLPFRLMDILVPLLSAYRPVSVGLGIMTLYLIALLNLSFYVQNRFGHRTWRVIHYASFAAYILATLHGILAGNSSGQFWMQAIYATSVALVLAATAYRLLQRLGVDEATRRGEAPSLPR